VRRQHEWAQSFRSLKPDQEIAVTIQFEPQFMLFADSFYFIAHRMLVIRRGGMLH